MDKEKLLNEIKQNVDMSNKKTPPKKLNLFTKKNILIFVFIALIILIIIFLLFVKSTKNNLVIYIVDDHGLPLKDALVEMSYKNSSSSKSTDLFGMVEFSEIESKQVNIKTQKENYLHKETEIVFTTKITEETITLNIDTSKIEFSRDDSEKRREIIFKNYDALSNDILNVTFKCLSELEIPQPRSATVTTGRYSVIQPKGCQGLLVSVVSDDYELITDREIQEDNIVELKKINSTTGILDVTVKNTQGVAITNATLKLYVLDDPATPQNESELIVSTGTTDLYGKYKFKIPQSNYLISVDKTDYVILPKTGPFTVVNNNTISAELILFTLNDLEDIDCSKSLYAPYCRNSQIDCNNPMLINVVSSNPNGEGCIIGKLSNLTIKLKDQNTNQEINADISIYKKDENRSTLILTRRDVNQSTFTLPSNRNYKIIVSNTEKEGYISPDPRDINNLTDGNKTIDIGLEYSSELNSGTIVVNVEKDGYNRANALVYLFYINDNETVLYNPETPKLTNLKGEATFNLVKSNREYYAYAILRNETSDGDSLPPVMLDNNTTLDLDVVLSSQLKSLNLKITPNQDYNFSFYNVTGDEIDPEEVILVNTTDANKFFVFSCESCSRIYLKIQKDNIIYQTDLISLFPGQTKYHEITFPSNLSSIQTTTEFLGLYDNTGTIKINKIGFTGDYDITKEYKLKFKSVFGSQTDDVLKKSFIKIGNYLTQNDDFLYLTNQNLFIPENTTLSTGCRFFGPINTWSNEYFNTHYQSDVSFTNCQSGKYKWVSFDFSDLESNVIEYSINFKFKNEITNPDNYKFYYRSINSNLETFSFSPSLTNWQDWSIQPDGFFYAPLQSKTLPFDNVSHSYTLRLFDTDSKELEKFGSDYILYLDNDYNYSLDFVQFSDINKTGDIITNTSNTNNNLVFKESYFKDKHNPIFEILTLDNNTSVTTFSKTLTLGYYFTNNLILSPINFFSVSAQPQIKTQLFKPTSGSAIETVSTNVLSYSLSDYTPEIISRNNDSKIYIGLNDIDISLKNSTGSYENDVSVRYIISDETTSIDLGTITNNYLNAQIFIPDSDSGKTITFIFTIPNSNLLNNELNKEIIIDSGIEVYNPDNQPNTEQNKLNFTTLILNFGSKIETSDSNNSYLLKNKTYSETILNEVLVCDIDGLLSETINTTIKEKNNLPTSFVDKEIISQVFISDSLEIEEIDFNFANIIKLQTENTPPTTLYRNTFSNLKINQINVTDNSRFMSDENNGFYNTDGNTTIELIDNIKTSFDLEYYLDLNFNKNIDYSLQEISIEGDVLSFINFNTVNDVIITNNKLNGSIHFVFSLISNPQNIITKDTILVLKIGNQNESFNYKIPLKIIVYPEHKTYELTTPLTTINIPCRAENDCSAVNTYNISNKTLSYQLNLTGTQMQDANPLTITVLPKDNITSANIPITIDGNWGNVFHQNKWELSYDKIIDFNLEINYQNLFVSKDLKIIVTYVPENPEITLSENGFNGNFCLGVGGDFNNNDYFILGSCEFEEPDVCKTGEDALPKILYDWGQTTETSVSWKTLCVDYDLEYDTEKTHCDSIQALYSIFSIIGSSDYNLEKDYYIYLMYDGVSKDLLFDFREKYNQLLGHNIDNTFANIYLNQYYDKDITLTKTTNTGTDTKVVGKYKIKINDFDPNYTKNLNINLELVQSIPLNKDNLLYYLPIDGDFGLIDEKVHRVGYGSSISGSYNYSDLIPIVIVPGKDIRLYEKSDCYNEDCGGIVEVIANYPTNNLIDWQVKEVLDSNGVLFDLSFDNSDSEKIRFILNFIPSKPYHIFAKVSDISNTNFNYRLIYGGNNFFTWNVPMFKWRDYENKEQNNLIEDEYVLGANGEYLRHTITKNKLPYTTYLSRYLLDTKIYLPSTNSNYNSLVLSLDNLGNNASSKLYGKEHTLGTTNLQLISNIENNVISIFDLFEQVKKRNACISKSLDNLKITWINEKTSLTSGEVSLILNNYKNDNS